MGPFLAPFFPVLIIEKVSGLFGDFGRFLGGSKKVPFFEKNETFFYRFFVKKWQKMTKK